MRFIIAIAVFVAGLSFIPTAHAQETFCVQATVSAQRWGIRWAIRQWNSVSEGPHLVLRQSCPGGIRVGVVRSPWMTRQNIVGYSWGDGRLSLNAQLANRLSGTRCVKRWTVTHEIGHSLGLGHLYRHPRSVMNWEQGSNCGTLSAADRELVRKLYR